MSIAENLQHLNAEIAAAVQDAGRAPGSVQLIAVSKFKPAVDVQVALDAGQFVFGENRVQEALEKFAGFRSTYPALELHLIGPLQTNKVRDAVQGFDIIQTLDRPKLATAIANALAAGPARAKKFFIEVNTGEEPQKSGILPLDADAFIRDCIDRLKLPVVGLMCVPPVGEEPSLHFAFLREMAKRHGLNQLSMGMSGDYKFAIAQGATTVRVGTAIFGTR